MTHTVTIDDQPAIGRFSVRLDITGPVTHATASAANGALRAALSARKIICRWHQDDEYSTSFSSDCGNYFSFTDDGPDDNGLRFCPFCGLPLTAVLFERDVEDAAP